HNTLTDLPEWTSEEVRAQAERDLVAAARRFDPVQVARVGQRIHAHLDPDGPEPHDPDPGQPHNELRMSRKRNGRLGFTGDLDAVAGTQLQALLSPLAKPRPAHEGVPDERTTSRTQRRRVRRPPRPCRCQWQGAGAGGGTSSFVGPGAGRGPADWAGDGAVGWHAADSGDPHPAPGV
ncbi:MAG: DUF222 domain-containing protein, partial [Pseudonocardiaceae bacterium]|nr:DUF222 domain-containing protein [Pseudonocardiaceae bacterium]